MLFQQLVALLAHQVRDVNRRHRVRTDHFDFRAGRERTQRLSRAQRRQRTFEPGKVQSINHAGADMAPRCARVNGG